MFFRTARFFHSSLWNRFVDLFYEKTTFKIVPSCETPYIDAERGPRENCYVHLYSSILALAIYNSTISIGSNTCGFFLLSLWNSGPRTCSMDSAHLYFDLGFSFTTLICDLSMNHLQDWLYFEQSRPWARLWVKHR